ncbi:MAG TPA: DUF3137 domain-containing protein [Abditibacteriaceae bacterium]|jgi:hypothetical protein
MTDPSTHNATWSDNTLRDDTLHCDTSRADANAALQSALNAVESERQRLAKEATNATIIWGLAVAALGLIIVIGFFGQFAQAFLFPILAGLIAASIAYNSKAQEYRGTYKLLIVDRVVQIVGSELRYSPRSHVSEREYDASQLFRSADRFNGEDLVQGRMGATQLQFSEIHAEYQTRNSKGQSQWHTIFRGVLFIADFNKSFQGVTIVKPDTAQRLLGRFGQSMQEFGEKLNFNQRDLVKLEDPEFEKMFVVSSTDQIEARYILSPSMMRRLLDLRARHGNELHISFILNRIYLALPQNSDLFEPPSLRTPLTVDAVRRIIADLQSVLCIVEDLDLNTRIWSKN